MDFFFDCKFYFGTNFSRSLLFFLQMNVQDKFTKYGWYVLIIIPFILAGFSFVQNGYKLKPICPDDFKDPKEEIASFAKWTNNFYNNNPNVSMGEMSEARRDFYVENNCTAALKRHDYFLLGNIDEETKKLMEMIILEKKSGELMDAEKYEEVISLNEEHIKNNPDSDNLDAWSNKAIAYYYLGDCLKASTSAYHLNVSISSEEKNTSEKLKGYSALFPYILKSDICNKGKK